MKWSLLQWLASKREVTVTNLNVSGGTNRTGLSKNKKNLSEGGRPYYRDSKNIPRNYGLH